MKSFADDKTLLDFALRHAGQARLAMRGSSMLPLLHEPYVLEVRRPGRKLRIGDIVLFALDQRLVAHRVVGIRKSAVFCAGDAHPDSIEQLRHDDILGLVTRVSATPDETSRRVDDPRFAALGWMYAHTRRLRALCLDAIPMVRPRAYASLVDLVSAVVRGERQEVERLVRSINRRRVSFLAERHRCAALLADALPRLSGDGAALSFASGLNAKRWQTALRTAKLRAQLRTVVALLNADGLNPVLLKGSARLWCDDPGADLHVSVDLDLLVDRAELAKARAALVRAGYSERTEAAALDEVYARHHHAPPLFPPGPGVSIELHHALAPAGKVSLDTSWASLQRFFIDVSRDGARARRLDPIGSALHLIVHGHERYLLRDLYLLARLLARMLPAEREQLRRELDAERSRGIAMHAMAAGAASLAGIEWPAGAHVAAFLDWSTRREDLPGPLRRRSNCYDAWMTGAGRPPWQRLHDVWCASKLEYVYNRPFKRLRSCARRVAALAAGAAIAAYAPLMRRP